MIGTANVLKAIRGIADGEIGSVRVVEPETFRHYSGLLIAIRNAGNDLSAVQLPTDQACGHVWDVELMNQSTSPADGTSAHGDSMISSLPLQFYVLSCACEAPADEFDSLEFLGDVNDDLHTLAVALGFPHNLRTTPAGDATGVIGGRLFGPAGDGDPEFKPGPLTDCRRVLSTMRATALVQSAQEI